MGSSSALKPRRPKLEPISLAELEADSTMVGFTSLFRIPMSEPSLPHLVKDQEASHRSGTLPVIDTLPVLQRGNEQWETGTLPVIDRVPDIDTVPDIGGLGLNLPEFSSPAFHPKQLTGFGNKKLYRCVLAQDGHSHGEEALYQVLWRAGKLETEETRLIAMGYGEMSKRIRLSFNNSKATCLRLIQKLAVEEVAHEVSHERIGKTYRIFSYKAILERRRSNNMEWVVKNKGVEFVIPALSQAPSILGGVPDIGIKGTLPDKDAVSISGREALSISGRESMSITGIPLENSSREVPRKTLPSSSSAVAAVLSEYGTIDDDAVQKILADCSRNAPDATLEEIMHFIREKGRVVANGKIDNPIGFLIVYVPKCFVGDTLKLYREQQRQRREAADREAAEAREWVAEHRRQQEQILADPDASEEDKQWARRFLSEDGN
jgi:hypothetical protein